MKPAPPVTSAFTGCNPKCASTSNDSRPRTLPENARGGRCVRRVFDLRTHRRAWPVRLAADRYTRSVNIARTTTRRAERSLGIKRAIDVGGAAGVLVVLSPLIAGVALLVRLRLGKPVIFTQLRPGRHAEPFTVYKFRTMLEAYD